ncbi:MAG: DUF559 domain-containing protein [Polyangiaceae bacterium]|nr:DUF559 domain-containing protein [Polyangiaceae bacterium]
MEPPIKHVTFTLAIVAGFAAPGCGAAQQSGNEPRTAADRADTELMTRRGLVPIRSCRRRPAPERGSAVDGGDHEARIAADVRRNRLLGRLGYRVRRLSAEAVVRDPTGAVARILATLGRGD